MAVLTSSDSLDFDAIDLSDWADPLVTTTFLSNVNLTSAAGRVYEDAVQATWDGDPNYRNIWGGSGLAFDSVTGALTAGTITGFFEQEFIGGSWVQTGSLEDFSIDAVLFSNVQNTLSTADDVAVIEAIFAGADTFNLSNQNDTVNGYAGNDTQNGNGGNDYLEGGAGDDQLNGSTGSDWASYRHAGAAVAVSLAAAGAQNTVGAGTDTFNSIEGVLGSPFADTLTGGTANGRFDLFGGGAGNDTIDGGVVSDTVNYSDGNQVEYWQTATTGVSVDLVAGTAADGQGGTDTLLNIDFVIGTNFNDTVRGSDGTLFESFTGMAGDDSFNGGDLSQASARVAYNISPAAVNVNLGTGTTSNDGYGDTDHFTNINFVRGSDFGDTLVGSNATAYTENFDGRLGNDTINGLGGTDQVRYDNAPGAVLVNLALGTTSGGDGADTLLNIENVRGSNFNDVLIGNAGANALDGRAGNDSLDGGAGDDTFVGSTGNDTFVGGTDDTFDYANYGGAGSAITVNLATHLVTSSSEGTDSLTGIEGVLGTAFDDSMVGDGESNYLRGNAGDDTLDGAGGTTDIADHAFAPGSVTVDLVLGSSTGDGTDVLLNIERVFGSSFADTLLGNAGDNWLRGRTGNDRLDGRAGADGADYRSASGAVQVSLVTNLSAGADGVDTLIAIEHLRGSELFGDLLTGNAVANELTGMDGNDTLLGNAGNDTLAGDGGADRLDGGAGIDSMTGGLGADLYVVDVAGDLTVETSTLATERDTVLSGVSRTLGANLENLILGGTAAIGTGNTLANTITGNASANTLGGLAGNDTLSGGAGIDRLDGGLGNDSMVGGTGSDTYVVNAAADLTVETSTLAAERDTVLSAVNRTLGANLENLTLLGTAAAGAGNGLANVITGNAAANTLSGAAGNDTLAGGAGKDVLAGGTGLDAFRFDTALNRTTNVDRISDFVAADDRFLLENAVFTQVGAVGNLAAGAFRLGVAAGDANDRIVYDRGTGNLYYDADGTGAAAQILFATLVTKPLITAADFVIT